MGKYRKKAGNRSTQIYEQAEAYAIWWMNFVSLFPFPFVKGQFKDDWVMYDFHKRIVANTLSISLKIEEIVCDGAEIDYTGQYKNNGIK